MTDPAKGMTISVRTRRDVVIVDVAKFLATAKQAYLDLNPDATDADEVVMDVTGAAYAIIERDGRLVADEPVHPIGGSLPGERALGRPDGLSPAGVITQVVVDVPQPLQDYGCFLPDDLFTSPPEP